MIHGVSCGSFNKVHGVGSNVQLMIIKSIQANQLSSSHLKAYKLQYPR